MDPSRSNRILKDWNAIASQARRPAAAPRPVAVRTGLPIGTLAGASLLVVGIVVAGLLLGRTGPRDGVGSLPSPSGPVASVAVAPASASRSISCQPDEVDARITLWEGAAGSRIADVELKNTGTRACALETMAKPQLVSGGGDVLIDGSAPASKAVLTLAPGGVVKTLVRASNYCGPAPVPPVTVDFITTDGALFVATAFSPTDTTLPPCNGPAGSDGSIEMQPWAR
jgi:hypothetical protein